MKYIYFFLIQLVTFNQLSAQYKEVFAGQVLALDISNATWIDYDNDGDLDVFVFGNDPFASYISKAELYKKTASGYTQEATFFGVEDGKADWGDYDNDGDLDLIYNGREDLNGTPHTRLYRNNGGSFSHMFSSTFHNVSDGDVKWGDLDNDGDLDIVLSGSLITKLYENTGTGFSEFHQGELENLRESSIALGDYDNDNDLDIIISGSTTSASRTLLYENRDTGFVEVHAGTFRGVHEGYLEWGDYDSDGDLDLVLMGDSSTFDYVTKVYNNTGSGFVDVFQGQFTKILDGMVRWGDIDQDGDLDLLAVGSDQYVTGTGPLSSGKIYRNDGAAFSNTGYNIQRIRRGSAEWGDFDMDGDLDILFSGNGPGFANSWVTKIYEDTGSSPNDPPETPINLDYSNKGNEVTLNWGAAFDSTTATPGLTYNVMIGTSSNAIDVVSPHSNISSGLRKFAKMGNAQLDTTFLIKDLPKGTYYWRVQTIDNNFEGSAFSIEDTIVIPATISMDEATKGLANNPLMSREVDKAVLGFSFESDSTPHVSSLKIDFSSPWAGKLYNLRLVKSTDDNYLTKFNNTILTPTTSTTANQISFSGLNEAVSSTTTYYFLIADVDSTVNSTTTNIQASIVADSIGTSSSVVVNPTVVYGPNYTFGNPAPTVDISTALNPTNQTSFDVDIEFNEWVSGFTISDIDVINGTTSGFTSLSAVKYRVNVTQIAAGNVTISVPTGAAIDASADDNLASGPYVVTIDQSAPTLTVNSVEPNSAFPKTEAALNVKMNERGKVYYVVLEDNSPAPAIADDIVDASVGGNVVKIGDININSANVNTPKIQTGLTDGTSYDLYFIGEDQATNLTDISDKYELTTRTVGIGEHASTQFTIYPNPANQLVYLEFNKNFPTANINAIVIDLQGKTVSKTPLTIQTGNKAILTTDQLKPGTYWVQLQELNGTILNSEKLIIHRQ